MSGTVFGLGLSQRVDSNGKPDLGWKLYIYEAASDTPVTSYKDTGLTVGLENPWPIEADSSGMMPQFWLADGSYRVRATSNDGIRTFFDLPNVLALGASSGSGGGGGGVDPNAIYVTGDIRPLDISGTIAGWVRNNGRTIGSATSGASERANADTQSLFTWLWNNFDNTRCPVLTGRGANPAADWAANKQITLQDYRGRSMIGLDDMGNTAAGVLTGVPFSLGNKTTAASLGGEALHTLTADESAELEYDFAGTNTSPVVDGSAANLRVLSEVGGSSDFGPGSKAIRAGGQVLITIDGTVTANAGGAAHNITGLVFTGTWYRKL